MRYMLALLGMLFVLPASAQVANTIPSCGSITMDLGSARPLSQDTKGRLCIDVPPYPSGVTVIAGNAAGTTGAVVGTLAAAALKTTYICDFDVSAAGTGSVGPVVVAGLLGGSKTYQLTAPATLSKSFTPCMPANAVNTAITVTTTADASATAVNVNSSGFQQ